MSNKKAITFLEWHKQVQDKMYHGISDCNFDERAKVFWNDSQSKRTFYSQPFKPEMITDIFEGWENNQGIRFHQNSNGTYFTIVFQGASDNCFYIKIYKDDDTELFKIYIEDVKTLDEFILRCNKVIELTYTPEIVNKYFK